MEQLKGILEAFVDFIQQLVGDNESLSGIFDTVKKILAQLTTEDKAAA